VNLEDEHIEGGVPVDIEVSLDPADEANGVDTIIEAAIEYLTSQKKFKPRLLPEK
jgi:hypothetical protein